MGTALIGLGSNLGDRRQALDRAIALLRETPQIYVAAVSTYRSSKPAGGPPGQEEFLNAAAAVETSLGPEELLATLMRVEAQVGRVREAGSARGASGPRWGPRVVDLDLLLYDRVEMKTPVLELPHPRMCFRRFVLEPAAEIASEMVWPVNGWPVRRLREHSHETHKYIAIHGTFFSGKRRLIEQVNERRPCRSIFGREESEFAELDRDVTGEHSVCELLTASLSKCIQWHAAAIEENAWPSDKIWTLSDFWYDAFILDCKLGDSNFVDTESCEEIWRLGLQTVSRPRLTIVLRDDMQLHRTSAYSNEQDTDESAYSAAEQHAIDLVRERNESAENLTRRPDAVPAIWLSPLDQSKCIHEVLAAMQAME